MERDIGVGELPQTWILVRGFCEGLSMGRPRVFVLLLSFSFLLNLECGVDLDPEFLSFPSVSARPHSGFI